MKNPHEDKAIDQLAVAEQSRAALAQLYRTSTPAPSQVADLNSAIRDAYAAAKVYAQLAVAWELRQAHSPGEETFAGVPIGPAEASSNHELARRLVEDARADFVGGKVRRGK